MTWEIDVLAHSHHEAAQKAREIQRDMESRASFFTVRAHGGDVEMTFDLLDNTETSRQVPAEVTVREIALGADEFEFGDGADVELKGFDGVHIVHDVRWR